MAGADRSCEKELKSVDPEPEGADGCETATGALAPSNVGPVFTSATGMVVGGRVAETNLTHSAQRVSALAHTSKHVFYPILLVVTTRAFMTPNPCNTFLGDDEDEALVGLPGAARSQDTEAEEAFVAHLIRQKQLHFQKQIPQEHKQQRQPHQLRNSQQPKKLRKDEMHHELVSKKEMFDKTMCTRKLSCAIAIYQPSHHHPSAHRGVFIVTYHVLSRAVLHLIHLLHPSSFFEHARDQSKPM